MRTLRSAITLETFDYLRARTPPSRGARVDPRCFGRGRARILAEPLIERRWTISEELALFATTFAAGFIFVSIFIA